ncbi:MAG: PKD domain-containing protein [Bacteroidota bacterium]
MSWCKKTIVIIMVIFAIQNSYSQSYNMGTSRRVAAGCNVNIYDNGGSGANYGANRNDTITIFSNNATNHFVSITIQSFDINLDDTLFIYNDSTANPAQLVPIGSLNVSWLNNSNSIIVGDWTYTANITNPSGAITLRLKTNGANDGAGFFITTACSIGCQTVSTRIDTLLTTPPIHREADGFFYVNVCPNQQVNFVGSGSYPTNNLAYNQSNDSTTFVWQLGDTTYTGLGLTNVSHNFTPGRGYDVFLQAYDQRGCNSSTGDYVRIRTSANPIVNIQPLPDICTGSPFNILVGADLASDIVITPISSIQQSSLSFDSTMFVPDGPNCTGLSDCYNTFVTFTSFLPGQSITSAADILSVCFTMEHSYLGDLQFKVVCPNSQSVITHAQPNGGSLYLGVPVDDGGGCSPDPSTAGTPWNYCWSDYPAYSYHGTAPNYLHQGQSTNCDSSNRANHTNFYHPMNSFAGLVGCPLNGTWSIEICDLFGIDDGWIYQWQLNLDPSLLPSPWSYTVNIDTILWSENYIQNTTDSSAIVIATQGGTFNYSFTIVDDFGCQFDSSITVTIVKTPLNNFGNDTSFCTNASVILYGGQPATSYLWSTGETTSQIVVNSTNSYWVKTTNSNGNISCIDIDTININVFPQAIVNYTANHLGCSPLNAQFQDLSTPTISQWLWTFGDGATSNISNPLHTYNIPGLYTTSLTVTTVDGCVGTKVDSNYVNVYENPVANFEPSTYRTTTLDPMVFFNDLSTAATTWEWTFGDPTSSINVSHDQNPIHTFSGYGIYKVTLTTYSEYGCVDSISKFINVENTFYFWIPNSFSPDKNGVNEVYRPVGFALDITQYSMEILDRWGMLIYKTNNYYDSWNGKVNNSGDRLKHGEYVYIFNVTDLTGKKHRYVGNVTLLR